MKRSWYRETWVVLAAAVAAVIIVAVFSGSGVATDLQDALTGSSPTPTASRDLIPVAVETRQNVGVTASYASECQTYGQYCRRALVAILNAHRAAVGAPALGFDKTLTWGANGCVGSQGHSKAMAATGTIWHISPTPAYDNASFYADIYPGCISGYNALGENAGEYPTTNRYTAIQQIDNLMMQEQHDGAYCASLAASYSSNHACTILSTAYLHVGVGLVQGGGTIYLTEDFH